MCPVSETSNSVCRALEPEFLLFWAHTAQRTCPHELFLMFSLYYLYNWSSPVGSLASNLGSFLNMMIYFFLCIQASAQSQQQKEQLERLRKDMGSVALDTGTATGIRGSLMLGSKRGVYLFLLSRKILIFKGRKRRG